MSMYPASYVPGSIEDKIDAKARRASYGRIMGQGGVKQRKRVESAGDKRVAEYEHVLGGEARDVPTRDDWLADQVGSSRKWALIRDFEAAIESAIGSGAGWESELVRDYCLIVAHERQQRPLESFYGVKEVCSAYGFQRMTLKRMRDRAEFPAPHAVVGASPHWRESDLPASVGTYTLTRKVEADACPF